MIVLSSPLEEISLSESTNNIPTDDCSCILDQTYWVQVFYSFVKWAQFKCIFAHNEIDHNVLVCKWIITINEKISNEIIIFHPRMPKAGQDENHRLDLDSWDIAFESIHQDWFNILYLFIPHKTLRSTTMIYKFVNNIIVCFTRNEVILLEKSSSTSLRPRHILWGVEEKWSSKNAGIVVNTWFIDLQHNRKGKCVSLLRNCF